MLYRFPEPYDRRTLFFLLPTQGLPNLGSNRVYSFGKALHVPCGNTRNRDTTIFGCVYRVLIDLVRNKLQDWNFHLHTSLANLFICSGLRPVYANMPIYVMSVQLKLERTTTYLRSNMAPIVFTTSFFQILLQQCTHRDDTVGHPFDLT